MSVEAEMSEAMKTWEESPSGHAPTWAELIKEVQLHRQILQGMALHLEQLSAQVDDLLQFQSFLVDSLGGEVKAPIEVPNVESGG